MHKISRRRKCSEIIHSTFQRHLPGADGENYVFHDDVIKWKHFLRNWPFVRGIHRSPMNSPHKGQWRGASMFFNLRLNKRLSKQSWGWWFETLSRSLWCHRNAILFSLFKGVWYGQPMHPSIRTMWHTRYILDYFKSLLTKYDQFCSCNSASGSSREMKMDVLQGPKLCQLLLIICIDDM